MDKKNYLNLILDRFKDPLLCNGANLEQEQCIKVIKIV